jgi:hypothetical protein
MIREDFALIFFHLQKANLEKISIYSNKFFHNFHLSDEKFSLLSLRANQLGRSPGQVKLDSDKGKLWKNLIE